ncbi:MAG: hypothetical protein UZ21_OP11001000554 [Microgenomates bacterium OLB22]|nr:MAG: hypothetical protein UZ21_OP11001000554 [Microgenomates bacterium OLB22]
MYNTNTDKLECIKCVDKQALPTGIGCIPLSFSTFIQDYVFRIGLGIAGVTALLMIIWASFQLQTSEGNPEKDEKCMEKDPCCRIWPGYDHTLTLHPTVDRRKHIGTKLLEIQGNRMWLE